MNTNDRRNLEAIRPMAVAELKPTLVQPFFVIAAWLALAALAGAQSVRNPQPISQPNSGNEISPGSSQVAPLSAGIPASGTSADHVADKRGANSRQSPAMLISGANEPAMPHVCFQPGTGWVDIGTHSSTQNSDARGNSPRTGVDDDSSHPLYHPAVKSRLNSATRTSASECPSGAGHAVAPGIGQSNSAAGYKVRSSPTQKFGELDFSRGVLSKPASNASGIDDLQRRAYISSIKLRRMSRNLPNLKSRLELRRVQTKLQKRPSKRTTEEMGNSSGGRATRGQARHSMFSNKASPCDRKDERARSHGPCQQIHR